MVLRPMPGLVGGLRGEGGGGRGGVVAVSLVGPKWAKGTEMRARGQPPPPWRGAGAAAIHSTMTRNGDGEDDLVSYRTLRRVVGVLGVALPVVVAAWGFALCHCLRVQPSISDYYALRTRDAFVGILFTIGWFLFAYRGYERRDDVAGNLACVFALAVALFPNTGTRVERLVHFGAALALFLVLAYFSLFLFTRTGGAPTNRKRMRNTVYRACGIAILLCIAGIGLSYSVLSTQVFDAFHPVFWLETVALWAFGLSWFVKGETILKDIH